MQFSPVKWIVPGIVTVLLGTAAIVPDHESRWKRTWWRGPAWRWGRRDRAGPGMMFDGRDAIFPGRRPGLKTRWWPNRSSRRCTGFVLSLRPWKLAPRCLPYPFVARIEKGVVTLEGGVPDETLHQALLAASGAKVDRLKLLSGVPDRSEWEKATSFALQQLATMEEGEVSAQR